jgi:hypothetical protein
VVKSTLAPVLFGGGLTLFFAGILALIARTSRRSYENVRRLAESLGIGVHEQKPTFGFYGRPEASGMRSGRALRVFNYFTGAGKSRKTWCALTVASRAPGTLAIELTPQTVFSKIEEFFGAREITVGDEAFDRAWFIRTNAPDFLKAALLPEVRARLTAAFEESRPRSVSIRLNVATWTYAEQGDFSNERTCARLGRMAAVLDELATIAELYGEVGA